MKIETRENALAKSRKIMATITSEPAFSEDARISRLHHRFVLVSTEYFTIGLMKDIIEFAGPDAAAVIMYRGGYNSGKIIFERFESLVNDKDMAMEMSAASAWYFGWGIASIYTERINDEIIGHARIYDSFEAEEYLNLKDLMHGKKCHFFRGVVAGIMTAYANKPYIATEQKCLADGDEYREFLIMPMKNRREITEIQ